MSPRQALLAAVLAKPDDDAPRLVYADWLEENGESEPAEYIRVGCQIDTFYIGNGDRHVKDCYIGGCAPAKPGEPHPCKICGPLWILLGRENDLRPRHPELVLFCRSIIYRRGFVEAITCDAIDWHAHANAIRAEHPIREVTLTTWPDSDGYFLPDGEPATMVAVGGKNEYVCARWPGITFHLPEQEESSRDRIFRLYEAGVLTANQLRAAL